MNFHSDLLEREKKLLISKIISGCKIDQLDNWLVIDVQRTIYNNFAIHLNSLLISAVDRPFLTCKIGRFEQKNVQI